MIVYILNSKMKNRQRDGLVLDENDFHPCHPFFSSHPEIKPESVERIIIKGVLERCKYKRAVLKYCDYMLAPNGILEVYYYNVNFENSIYVRARNDWQYELSLVFGSRIHLIEQNKDSTNGYFLYKKVAKFLPEGDTIDHWTFGIVSSGRLNDRVMNLIQQIADLHIPQFEILICGPAPSDILPSYVRILSDSHMYSDIRIPISKKKNYIIDEAKYNNLVLMHDRYSIPPRWFEKMRKYGNYFDLLVCNVIDEKNNNVKLQEWCYHYLNPFPNTLSDILIKKYRGNIHEIWNENIYISGGWFVMKKHLGLHLNPDCNWGEKEDVDFCRRSYYNGILMEFDPNNTVYSTLVRFNSPYPPKSWKKVLRFLTPIRVIRKIYGYYRERKKFVNYLKSINS